MIYKRFLIILVFIFCFTFIFSIDDYNQVIINSENWEDVYSSAIYSNLNNIEFKYISDTDDVDEFIKYQINKNNNKIFYIEGINPISSSLENKLKNNNFEITKVLKKEKNINYKLSTELKNFESLILLDSKYSYNAISVLPYANLKSQYVLFTNKKNIDENKILIEKFNNLLLIGKLDREVSDYIKNLDNKEITYIDEKNKFLNNLKITKLLLDKLQTKVVILSNGELLEEDILSGNKPILFIGKNEIPEKVYEFIEENNIKQGVLLDKTKIEKIRELKKNSGIENIYLKISKGYADETKDQLSQRPLGIFKIIPKESQIDILSINYNKVTEEFLIEIVNNGDSNSFVKTTLFLFENEKKIETISKDFIEEVLIKEIVTHSIPYKNFILKEEFKFQVNVLYGENKDLLDKEAKKDLEVEVITLIDDSNIEIKNVIYDFKTKRFKIQVENKEDKEVYVQLKLEDVLIDEEKESFVSK